MTWHEFTCYYEQQMNRMKDEKRLHERFSARICSIIANANRNTKRRRKPFSEEEFMAGYEKKKLNPEQFATVLKVITMCNGGEVNG